MMNLGLIELFIGLIIFAVLFIALVVLVIWAVRRTSGGAKGAIPGGPAVAQSAREVLQMRYARGEITREQYQQMLQDLDV